MKHILLKLLFVCGIMLLHDFSYGQRGRRYKWEAGIDVGASNFLGDLGGANQIGTHFLKDLELSMTQPAIGAHIRYRKAKHFGYKATLEYGKVIGADWLTQEPYRNNRNLNFKTNIIECSFQLEFYFSKLQQGHQYSVKSSHRWKNIDIQEYVFAGVGGFYYNPKGDRYAIWYPLRQFHTEGEGFIPGTKVYSNYSVCFPVGVGMKYGLNRRFSIGLEYGVRYTMTDYIDDVSTVYVDPDILRAHLDPSLLPLALYFANPTTGAINAANNGGIDPTAPKQQRGDSKHNDAYMFMQITVNYKLGKMKKTHSKF